MEITHDIAKRVLQIWDEHLGYWQGNMRPPILSGESQYRIGSRYTEDSALVISKKEGKLIIECNAMAQTAFGRIKQDGARESQESFNKAVASYISSLEKISADLIS